jgi:hypothetical protein
MDRRITGIKKDRFGNIVALCNPGQSWSPRLAVDVARDIGTNERSYYVQVSGRRIYVKLVSGGSLQTTKDASSAHNLGNLPVC